MASAKRLRGQGRERGREGRDLQTEEVFAEVKRGKQKLHHRSRQWGGEGAACGKGSGGQSCRCGAPTGGRGQGQGADRSG